MGFSGEKLLRRFSVRGAPWGPVLARGRRRGLGKGQRPLAPARARGEVPGTWSPRPALRSADRVMVRAVDVTVNHRLLQGTVSRS